VPDLWFTVFSRKLKALRFYLSMILLKSWSRPLGLVGFHDVVPDSETPHTMTERATPESCKHMNQNAIRKDIILLREHP
jgi:hypothetical protein